MSKSSNKASHEELDSLHGLVARELMKKIRSGEATSADFSVATKFLKDNGVEQAALPGTPIANLAASLPFAGSESYPQ